MRGQVRRLNASVKKKGTPRPREWADNLQKEARGYAARAHVEEVEKWLERDYLVVLVDKDPECGLIIHNSLYSRWLHHAGTEDRS